MTMGEEISWAVGEIGDHPGRLGLITAIGVIVAAMIMFQNAVMPWERATPNTPTINNTTIIRVPGQPDRTVVRTSQPGQAHQRPAPVETSRATQDSAAPRPTRSAAVTTPQPRPQPVPDNTPRPRPTETHTPRPTVTPRPSASATSSTPTPEPTVPESTPTDRVTVAPPASEGTSS